MNRFIRWKRTNFVNQLNDCEMKRDKTFEIIQLGIEQYDKTITCMEWRSTWCKFETYFGLINWWHAFLALKDYKICNELKISSSLILCWEIENRSKLGKRTSKMQKFSDPTIWLDCTCGVIQTKNDLQNTGEKKPESYFY